MIPGPRDFLQQAWVVDDLEAAAQRFSATMNIGPFFLAEYKPEFFESVEYRGKPGTLQMRTAICYAGAVQIELIQPTGDGDSCYRDTVMPGTEAFHHICFWTHDLDADIARYRERGFPVANRARVKKGPAFAYIDASQSMGCMIELLEYSPGLAGVFDGWRERCANWDGGELFVRR